MLQTFHNRVNQFPADIDNEICANENTERCAQVVREDGWYAAKSKQGNIFPVSVSGGSIYGTSGIIADKSNFEWIADKPLDMSIGNDSPEHNPNNEL